MFDLDFILLLNYFLLVECRAMLDQWNMFGERSELDAALTRSDPDWETQQKVFVACNYCGKSISGAGGRQRSSKSGTSSRQTGNGSKPQVG